VGIRGQRLSEAKREIADRTGNRMPVNQHGTSDAFVTAAICIGLLKSDPEGSTLLAVKRVRFQVRRHGCRQQLHLTVTGLAGVRIYGRSALFRCAPG